MRVFNVHQRSFAAPRDGVGRLVDGLASESDALWPHDNWPAMRFPQGLTVGSKGGHGPIRYTVTEVIPGARAAFRFDPEGLAAGFSGSHYFDVVPNRGQVILRHVIDARCGLGTWLKWMIVVRPLHNALAEDALDRAERELTGTVHQPNRWGLWVRTLRSIVARRDRAVRSE